MKHRWKITKKIGDDGKSQDENDTRHIDPVIALFPKFAPLS